MFVKRLFINADRPQDVKINVCSAPRSYRQSSTTHQRGANAAGARMTFSFVTNSEAQYKLALLALMRHNCDENEGMSNAELNERAIRLLRLSAHDFYPAKQLLAACCLEDLVDAPTLSEVVCIPPMSMRALAKKARLKK